MDMLGLEITKHSKLKEELKSVAELSKGILEALFNIECTESQFKNEKTRGKALKLLEVLDNNYPQASEIVRDYLFDLQDRKSVV